MSSSFVTPCAVARQAPLSMGFPKQGFWNGLPFPTPGYLLDPGIEFMFHELTDGFFTTELLGKPYKVINEVDCFSVCYAEYPIISVEYIIKCKEEIILVK